MSALVIDAPSTRRGELAPLLVVAGGKGGVGKSVVCANLGVALARRGRRVLLVDLDLGLGNLHVLVGAAPTRTLESVLLSGQALESAIMRVAENVDLLPAGSGDPSMAVLAAAHRERLHEGIRELRRRYDVVLADAAAGIGPDVLSPSAHASRVLVVTTPEPAALTDAYGLIKALDAHGSRNELEIPTPELFVNLVAGTDEAERVARGVRAVSERFLVRSPRLAGWLPRCREAARSVFRARPFALENPASLSSRCIDALAAHVERSCALRALKLCAGSAD